MKQLTGNSKVALGFATMVSMELIRAVSPNPTVKNVCRGVETVLGAGLCIAYMVPEKREKKEDF